jgi:aspartyl-tRNA(Asn)/glutamyl-tRNA(Gln) amidotransferase subunit C
VPRVIQWRTSTEVNMAEKINIDVKKVAELAKLTFTDEELTVFISQFQAILEYISQINELELDNVEPMASPLPWTQRLREDNLQSAEPNTPESNQKMALANAPRSKDGFFVVPKVIE